MLELFAFAAGVVAAILVVALSGGDGCGEHHYGDKQTGRGVVYGQDDEVFMLEFKKYRRCEHNECWETKDVGTKKLYVPKKHVYEEEFDARAAHE